MDRGILIESEGFARGNIFLGAKNVSLEVSRVYHLIRANLGGHYLVDKFFVIGMFREGYKSKGMLTRIHNLHTALIIAALQLHDIKPQDITDLPSFICDEVLSQASKHGFATTRFDIMRAYKKLKKNPEYFQKSMVDDSKAFKHWQVYKPIYRQGVPDDYPY